MDTMNTFQQCWQNWTRHPFGQPNVDEHGWINEFNQAVFSRFEKILPASVKVRAVTTPAFLYHVEAPGGYGVDTVEAKVETQRIRLPKDASFEARVNSAVMQLLDMVKRGKTVFIYTPVVPICETDLDGGPNRHMMGVRIRVVGETVDVGQQSPERNT